jgi:hypothetical protein
MAGDVILLDAHALLRWALDPARLVTSHPGAGVPHSRQNFRAIGLPQPVQKRGPGEPGSGRHPMGSVPSLKSATYGA